MLIKKHQYSIPNYGGNYDDLPPVPIINARLGATAPTLATFIGNIQQYTFDASDDFIIGSTEVVHSYKEGTNLEMHVHWATNGVSGSNKYVKWRLEYTIANVNCAFSSGSSIISMVETVIPANTPNRTHMLTNLGSITGLSKKIGAYIIWRFSRATASGTPPTTDPFALAIGFHIRQNSLGSRSEYIK